MGELLTNDHCVFSSGGIGRLALLAFQHVLVASPDFSQV